MKITKTQHSVKNAYVLAINSAAFYTVLIAFSLLAVAWGATSLDKHPVGEALASKVPLLRIDSVDTARSLLASLLKGLLIFILPMMTVAHLLAVPKSRQEVRPDMASKRATQVALGTVIGAVGFIIVVLSNFSTGPSGPEGPVLKLL